MIDVAVIGFGLAGRAFHAQVIRATPGLRLAAILQRRGDEAAKKYPDVPVVRTLEQLLAMRQIRLVVIATPNETHASLARACMEAGRDVVVDKPFTTTFAEAQELVELARKLGRLLTVYQNRRYDGDFQALRKLIAGGSLGRIVRFESNYDRYRPALKAAAWREQRVAGAGILFDLAPHLIDHALVLFGLPEAVTADVRVERDDAVVDDAFDVMLHYSGALRAVLRSTMLAAAQRPRFVVQGTRAAFFKQNFDPQEINLRNGITFDDPRWNVPSEENWGVLTTAENGVEHRLSVPPEKSDYRDYYANVRDSLLGKAELAVTPEHALHVMRILEMARQSSEQRRIIFW